VKKICGWCATHGRKPMVLTKGPSRGPVSHGICPTCARQFVHGDPPNGITHLVRRVLQQFVAIPGLLLSVSQVQRLLEVDAETCVRVLQCLVDADFVHQVGLDTYGRRSGHA
jgi:transposase-like protein